jgi:hypothetical protein
MRLLATFRSSHAALAAERRLLDAGLPVELIPVPRQVHSDCGFCLLGAEHPPGGAQARAWLEALEACGARGVWQVASAPAGPGQREEKTYERIA